MISRTAEYALRAMTFLAQGAPAARTVREIHKATRVPEGYLSKVMQALTRAGLVRSQRGLHGGFTLEKDPADLTILEVVNAVDPVSRILTCPLGLESHGEKLCPMHRRLDDAIAMVEEAFRGSTLAELLAEPGDSTPLCEFPRGR
jgi:Rrf2 family transcriptional regulator, nitric oxide-sensitive transcriptional repressor